MPFPMHQNPGDLSRVGGANDFANGVGNTTNENIDPALRFGAGPGVAAVNGGGIGVGNGEMEVEVEIARVVGRKRNDSVGSGNAAWNNTPRSVVIIPNVIESLVLQSQGGVDVPEDTILVEKRSQKGKQTPGASTKLPSQRGSKQGPMNGTPLSLQGNQSGPYEQVKATSGNTMKRNLEAYMNDLQGLQARFTPNTTSNESLQTQGGLRPDLSSNGVQYSVQAGQTQAFMNEFQVNQQQHAQPSPNTTWMEAMSIPDSHQTLPRVDSPQMNQAFGLDQEDSQRTQIQENHMRINSDGDTSKMHDFMRTNQIQTNPFTNPYQQHGSDVTSGYHTTMEPARNPLNQRQSIPGASSLNQQQAGNSVSHSQHTDQGFNSPALVTGASTTASQKLQRIQQYPQQNRPHTPVSQAQNPQPRQNVSPMILQPPPSFFQQQQGYPPPIHQSLHREEVDKTPNLTFAAIPGPVLGQRNGQQVQSAQNLANSSVIGPSTPVQTATHNTALKKNQHSNPALQGNRRPQYMKERSKPPGTVKVGSAKKDRTLRVETQIGVQNDSSLQSQGNQGFQQQPARVSSPLDRSSTEADIRSRPPNRQMPLESPQELHDRVQRDAMSQIFQHPRLNGREFDHMRSRSLLTDDEQNPLWNDLERAERALFNASAARARIAESLMMNEKNRISKIKGIKSQARQEKKKPSSMMMDLMEHVERFDKGGYRYGILAWENEGDETDEDGDGDEGCDVSFDGGMGGRGSARRGPGRPRGT